MTQRTKEPPISTRPLAAGDWKIIEELFGTKGACGGCWCMWWRIEIHGKNWEARKGPRNKRDFKKLVTTGRACGCLAFAGDQPVGWCGVGPRSDFPRIDKTKGLQTQCDERTWCVNCFYIKSGWRGKGVGTALLAEAIKLARKGKARILEAYPVNVKRGQQMPAAFAWTGLPTMFRKAEFKKTRLKGATRDVYRLQVRRSP